MKQVEKEPRTVMVTVRVKYPTYKRIQYWEDRFGQTRTDIVNELLHLGLNTLHLSYQEDADALAQSR